MKWRLRRGSCLKWRSDFLTKDKQITNWLLVCLWYHTKKYPRERCRMMTSQIVFALLHAQSSDSSAACPFTNMSFPKITESGKPGIKSLKRLQPSPELTGPCRLYRGQTPCHPNLFEALSKRALPGIFTKGGQEKNTPSHRNRQKKLN